MQAPSAGRRAAVVALARGAPEAAVATLTIADSEAGPLRGAALAGLQTPARALAT